MERKRSRIYQALRGAGFAVGLFIAALILFFLTVNTWPIIGAQGADLLRNLIGDKAVAGLEMKFNQVQDGLEKVKFRLYRETPAAPWDMPPATPEELFSTVTDTKPGTSFPQNKTPVAIVPTPTPFVINLEHLTSTPTRRPWQPENLAPLGTAEEEGIWSAYIKDPTGSSVAYRTFLEPDPSRPYTLVAIVAVDLTSTRLHFVLGSEEPAGENKFTQLRSGAIPPTDRAEKVLLAAFNGGFKARHGQFGAMSGGITALPPRDGFGTLVIYKGGKVSLAEWKPGSDVTTNILAYRQNGPLVIQEGQINPAIHNNSPLDWGYTVDDVSPTVRSGVGLSRDGNTLYYFCGPSLSMEMLAKSMQAAGAWNAIQLDINNYWTLFVKFQSTGSSVVPEALLPRLMVANIDRYLGNFTRDYFYITSLAR